MIQTSRRAAQAASFGAAATAYDRARPTYPAEAIDWILEPALAARAASADAGRPLDVLELGAGTGKLTVKLVERGFAVTAVEPNDGMRDILTATAAGATVVPGSGEAVPAADGSFDIMIAAQAWHWVDTAKAVPEVARVLRPGGHVGLVWNARDEATAWVRALGDILREAGDDLGDVWSAEELPGFSPLERTYVHWAHPIETDRIVDLVASRSYIITMEASERAAVLERVSELVATHEQLARVDVVDLPYVTTCYRSRLLD